MIQAEFSEEERKLILLALGMLAGMRNAADKPAWHRKLEGIAEKLQGREKFEQHREHRREELNTVFDAMIGARRELEFMFEAALGRMKR